MENFLKDADFQTLETENDQQLFYYFVSSTVNIDMKFRFEFKYSVRFLDTDFEVEKYSSLLAEVSLFPPFEY